MEGDIRSSSSELSDSSESSKPLANGTKPSELNGSTPKKTRNTVASH